MVQNGKGTRIIMTRPGIFILLYLLTVFATFAPPLTAKESKPTCALLPKLTGVIKAITPQNTFLLEGGQELVLANVKTAHSFAHTSLFNQMLNRPISYYSSGRIKDRHNRFLAQITNINSTNTQPFWLQAELIKNGLAMAYATPQNTACLPELLQHERIARKARRGEWAEGKTLKVYQATDIKQLNQIPQGKFLLVTGRVTDIGRSGQNSFINFSSDWKKDFTILIEKRLLQRKTLNWPKLKSLIGKKILVRGWLDHWGGPMIRVHLPAMLEVIDP